MSQKYASRSNRPWGFDLIRSKTHQNRSFSSPEQTASRQFEKKALGANLKTQKNSALKYNVHQNTIGRYTKRKLKLT